MRIGAWGQAMPASHDPNARPHSAHGLVKSMVAKHHVDLRSRSRMLCVGDCVRCAAAVAHRLALLYDGSTMARYLTVEPQVMCIRCLVRHTEREQDADGRCPACGDYASLAAMLVNVQPMTEAGKALLSLRVRYEDDST